MQYRKLILFGTAISMAGIFAACGGSSNVAEITSGGTGIVASGTISGFGSVYVNGVKFTTSAATKISDDDVTLGEDKLKVGQVVEIKGTSQDDTNGSADSIAVMKELKGPVDKLFDTSATPNTLGVLGQIVIVDNNTIIDNNVGANGLADLKLNDAVEVNGFREAAGTIRATRIERQDVAAAGQFKVSGTIDSIVSSTAFKVGDLTINYAGVTVKNLPAGGLVPGLQVKIKAAAAPVNKALTATSVEVKKGVDGKSGDKAELEGLVANFDGNCKFSVDTQAVDACGSVTFVSGVRTDLANGKRIEASGSLTNGVLIASKIEFKSQGDNGGGSGISTTVRVRAPVQTLLGKPDNTITLLGKTFKVSGNTEFEDDRTRRFNADNFATVLLPGDVVEIRGFVDKNGQLNAVLLERTNSSGIFIQGKLEQNVAAQLTIQGVVVRPGINTKFKDRSGNTLSRSQFDATPIGTIVKAKGTNNGTSDNTIDVSTGEVDIEN
jgi:Domain of unknown function (DUF5666)